MTAGLGRYRLAASIALVVPAVVFVIANVLRFELGVAAPYDALEPVIRPAAAWAQRVVDVFVFIGPLAAFVLAGASVVKLRLERRSQALVGSVEVHWHPALLAIAVVSALVFGLLGAYVIAENLPCVLGVQAHC